MRPTCAALTLLAALLAPGVARAGNCRIQSAPTLGFGAYNPFSPTPNDALATVSYDCNGANVGPAVIITLSAGGSGNPGQRLLRSGPSTLAYNVYADAQRTVVFGDGAAYPGVSGVDGRNQTVALFGRIPAAQLVNRGAYTDTLTLTLNF